MQNPLVAINQLWSAWKQSSRHWIWFFAGVALLTGGFHFRILPASLIVTAQGTPLAALGVALACLFVVGIAAILWLIAAPQASADHVLERTCLSLMLASMLCVWACIGPIGGTFYAHGRFVRMAMWIVSFGVLQLAWMQKWDQHVRDRLPRIWRERNLISWPDAILVGLLAVFAAEMATYFDRPYIQVTPFALVMNVALLSSAIAMAWGLFGRGLFAVVLTMCGYFTLTFLNVQKLKYLHAGLQPGDQVYLSELLYYKEYFTPRLMMGAGVVLALSLGILVWTWRISSNQFSLAARGRMFVGAAVTFVCFALIPWLPGSGTVLRHLGIVEETWDSYASVKRNGLLCELAMQLPESYVPTPANYNQTTITQILAAAIIPASLDFVPAAAETPAAKAEQSISIIIFLFESLSDPRDLNRPLRREVIPHIRQLQASSRHGFAISPRLLGGSAESEFEVLTGMSTGFLPPNSCAYKHFMKHPVPCLVSLLKAEGYHTTAVQVVPSGFYNYREVYQHLGFNRFRSEENLVNPKRLENSPIISDETFVDEMLRSWDHEPSFISGFNQASHAPYHAHMLRDQPRFLVEPSNPASDQIEVYLQAIARTDEQIGRLIKELEQRPDPVVLLLVGDHHPPFSADSHAYEIPAYQAPGPAGELFRRRVPFVIWKNFEDANPSESETESLAATAGETYVSMNFLSLLLLKEAGIEPQGLFEWNQHLFAQCPVISRNLFYTEGKAKVWDELSPALQKSIQEYQLLQYDMLLGEDFAAKLWKPSKRIARQKVPKRIRTS